MIVLKILLWIVLAVLGIILLLLILPIKGRVGFIDGKLSYSAGFSLLKIIDSESGGLYECFKKFKNKKKKEKPKDDDIEDMSSIEKDTEVSFGENDTSAAEKENEAKKADIPEKNEAAPSEETGSAAKEKDAEDKEKLVSEERYDDDDNFDFDDEDDSEEEASGGDKIEFVLTLLEIADRPLLKILKGIKLSDLYIDFIIANEDAYKCALNYGRISGAVYVLLGWLSVIFNVKLKTVDINPGFALDKSRWDASVKVSFRLITPVIAGIWFLIIYFFKVFIPSKLKSKKK